MLFRILTSLLLLPLGATAQSPQSAAQSAPQSAGQADSLALRLRDAHQDLVIIADPYISAARYDKDHFGKKSPYEAGIVAIDVTFQNGNEKPIRINGDTIQLIISLPDEQRQRLGPLSPEDVADRTLLNAPHTNPSTTHRPFPFPGASSNSGKGKAWNEMVTTLRSVSLSTDILPPKATTHGILFFDMNHNFDAVRQSHLYIPDLSFMADNRALLFFEIDLAETPRK